MTDAEHVGAGTGWNKEEVRAMRKGKKEVRRKGSGHGGEGLKLPQDGTEWRLHSQETEENHQTFTKVEEYFINLMTTNKRE